MSGRDGKAPGPQHRIKRNSSEIHVTKERLALLLHSMQSPDDFLHAEVVTPTDTRCHRVKSHHLATAEPLLLRLRSAPECAVERCIRCVGIFEPEDLGYSGKRPTFVA